MGPLAVPGIKVCPNMLYSLWDKKIWGSVDMRRPSFNMPDTWLLADWDKQISWKQVPVVQVMPAQLSGDMVILSVLK